MPLIMLTAGALGILLALRGDPQGLGAQFANDAQGSSGFATFALAFFVIGAIGFIPGARPVSWAFIGLMVVAIVLGSRGELFTKAGEQWREIVGAQSTTGASSVDDLRDQIEALRRHN